MFEFNGFEVYWDGHASVRVVDDGFTVAVDPHGEVSPDFEADLVLITRGDEGHWDTGKLESVCKGGTCVVVPESIEKEDVPCSDVEYIEDGEVIDIFGIEIEAVPIYREGRREEGNGYRFVMRDNSFYVAGDTGLVDEAFELENRVDVAFLPVEGDYAMDVEEAVKMAVRIKPRVTIPYQYGEPFFSDGEINTKEMKAGLEDRNLNCKVLEPDN